MLKHGLKEEKTSAPAFFSSSDLVLPKELPSIEEALKLSSWLKMLRRIQEIMGTLKAQVDVKRLSKIFTDLIRRI